jgi:hypothetical protein
MMSLNRCRFFKPESESVFYCGLDLGQYKDYSAWCVVERCPGISPEYHVRSLKRFALGTRYPEIVKKVQIAARSSEIEPNLLLVDNTGVGIAVSDLLRQARLNFWPITITGGDKVTRDGRNVRVPKRDLVSALQVLFQTKRLKIASSLPEAQTLIEELSNFQVKISLAGHDSYGEGTHDDLVLAVALACWAGENKLLPKGLRWPRPNTRRKPLRSTRGMRRRGTQLFAGPRMNLYCTFLTGEERESE